MATAVLDIWNMALGNLGSSSTIESISENTKERKLCSRYYEQCRDYLLRKRYYGFSTKASQLAVVSGQSYPGWAYVYAYPSDCLFLRAVTDSAGDRLIQGNIFATAEDLNLIPIRVPFKVVAKNDLLAPVIVTDLADAYGIFTARVTVPAVWSPQFTEALAYRLAWKIAPAMNCDPPLIAQLFNLANLEDIESGVSDLNEQRSDTEAESPSVAIRG